MRWLTLATTYLILFIAYFRLLLKPGRTPWQRVTVYTSLGYLIVVAWLVFAPVGLQLPDSFKQLSYFHGVPYNLHPLVHVDLEFLANIALTIPMGVYLYLFKPRLAGWQVVLLALVPGCLIESVQFCSDLLVHTARVADIDDIITNTSGVLVGYLAVWLAEFTPLTWLVKHFSLVPANNN